VLVRGRGQPVARGRFQDDALLHALPGVAVVTAGLVDRGVALLAVLAQGLLPLEHGDREVREIQLVAAVLVVLFRLGLSGPHALVLRLLEGQGWARAKLPSPGGPGDPFPGAEWRQVGAVLATGGTNLLAGRKGARPLVQKASTVWR